MGTYKWGGINRVTIFISHISPFITTHDPPSVAYRFFVFLWWTAAPEGGSNETLFWTSGEMQRGRVHLVYCCDHPDSRYHVCIQVRCYHYRGGKKQ